jgi:hypothetical protein
MRPPGGPRARAAYAEWRRWPPDTRRERVSLMRNAVFALVVCLAAGCNGLIDLRSAEQVCAEQAEASGPTFSVAGAFATNVGALRELGDDADAQPELWHGTPSDTRAVICYLDGPVPKAPPGGEPFDRAVVGIVGGEAVLLVAGYQDTIKIETP